MATLPLGRVRPSRGGKASYRSQCLSPGLCDSNWERRGGARLRVLELRAVQAVNSHLTKTYWLARRHIVEFEQAGKLRTDYGKTLINNLVADLGLRHGKGFSRSNLVYMRLLSQRYPISQKPSHQLSWSQYIELLKLDDGRLRN